MGRAPITHNLIIPSATRHLAEVRRFVVAHAQQAEVNEQLIEALRLAVDEACTNVIKHAYKGDPNEEVSLTMTIESTHIIVQIQDRGRPFDQEAYRRPNVLRLSRERKSGGLGVDIIRRLMDKVEYLSKDDINEIKLTKFLHQSS